MVVRSADRGRLAMLYRLFGQFEVMPKLQSAPGEFTWGAIAVVAAP
jgi:hypothetical protein